MGPRHPLSHDSTCVMNESSHTYQRVMVHISMSHGTHITWLYLCDAWVISHISTSHGTHINESWYTYHMTIPVWWMSHVTHINESSHTYQWVMILISMRHVTARRRRVMSRTWENHVTYMNESCRVSCHTSATSQVRSTQPWHVTHMNTSRHLWEWNMLLTLRYTATHCCNTLQHIATHCNIVQHTVAHC